MEIQDRQVPAGGRVLTLMLVVTGIGLGMRLWRLTEGGLDYHELILARLTTGDVDELWRQILVGRPPLYPALTWLLAQMFGTSLWALRLPSALFSAAAVPFVFLAGRRLFDGRVGMLAAVMMAISPFQLQFAQSHRYYGLMVFLGVVSVWLLLRALGVGQGGRAGGDRRDWASYIAVSTLLFYTQPMAMFTVAAVAVVMGVMTVRGGLCSRQQARFWGAQIAIVALALPWLVMPILEVIRNTPQHVLEEGRVPWLAVPTWYTPVRAPINFLVLWVGHLKPVSVVAGSALLAAGALGAVLRGRSRGRGRGGFANLWGLRRWVGSLGQSVMTGWWERERSWGFVGSWALGPLLLGLAVSWTMKPVYQDHYFIPASPGFYIALAALLVIARKAVPLRASFSALGVVMVGAAISYYEAPDRNAWADAQAWVAAHRGHDERIAFASERGVAGEADHLRLNWLWYGRDADSLVAASDPLVSLEDGAPLLGVRLRAVCGKHAGLWLLVRRAEDGGERAWFPKILDGPQGGVVVTDHVVFGDLVILRAQPVK
ncbi:MAG: glycosyltransferase family 39 protein [Algisphaera sp.]